MAHFKKDDIIKISFGLIVLLAIFWGSKNLDIAEALIADTTTYLFKGLINISTTISERLFSDGVIFK